ETSPFRVVSLPMPSPRLIGSSAFAHDRFLLFDEVLVRELACSPRALGLDGKLQHVVERRPDIFEVLAVAKRKERGDRDAIAAFEPRPGIFQIVRATDFE